MKLGIQARCQAVIELVRLDEQERKLRVRVDEIAAAARAASAVRPSR